MGDYPGGDASQLGGYAQRARTNNVSMVPQGREQRSSLGLGSGLRHHGTLSPGGRSQDERGKQMFHSQLDSGRRGNDKTGAPVNFVMQPEGDDDDKDIE